MYLPRPAIHAAAAACEDAGREIAALFSAGEIADEDDFTSALIQGIRSRLNCLEIGGVAWHGRKTTSRFEGSEENRSGADLLGVLEVDLADVAFRKGFLAQAKREKGGHGMQRLRQQCQQMLALTPDSFVFLYGKKGVEVLPALLYAEGSLGLRHADPWDLERFFAAHFASFIGDRKLGVASREEFQDSLDALPPREILVITASLGERYELSNAPR
jgi:hypothetical protein